MSLTANLTHQTLEPQSVISIGYYGQKMPRRDYPESIVPAKHLFISYETPLEKSKRYAWTLLPLLTLIPPIGTVVHVLSETVRTSKIASLILKSRDLKTASYHAFRGLLGLSTVMITIFERSLSSSAWGRRLCLGIKLLTICHEIYIAVHRMRKLRNDEESKFDKLCFHILNNIFCLFALIFKNPWTTAAFLAMQGVSGFFHAERQGDKGKDFKGFMHLGISLLRFTQILYILFHHLSPKKEKTEPISLNFEELREARRQLLIAPSETLKTELSKYETAVKNSLGEEYLYFKRTGPKEKFLILSADADHNHVFDPFWIKPIIQKLSETFDVKFRTIYKVEDIQKEILIGSQTGRVMGLLLQGHGEPFSIQLSKDPSSGWLTSKNISPLLFEGLDPNCVIALDSCSTAGYPYISIAYRVANLSQRITFAAANNFSILSLKQASPLEWSFENRSNTVRTKKLIPLKDDSFLTFLKSLFR